MANETKKPESNLDFGYIDDSFFKSEAGAQVRTKEQLNEISKHLPKWSIEPPAKYREEKKTDA